MRPKALGFLLILTLLFSQALWAQNNKKQFKYVGVKTCKMCHMTRKSGAAYKIWQKSKHAQAYAVLATEKAKAIAKKKGIKDPQKADECLSCHVTAHGVSAKLIGPKFKIEDGVGCESCHGPGSAYKSKKVMTAVYKGKTDPATVGLIKPTEKTCLQCHNKKSPTFKGFDFKKMFKQIEHPVPKKAAK